MKNQYFGDINDYRKYGLLRIIADDGRIKTAICWMLTSNDNRTDGKFIQYLDQPIKWQKYDSELFDLLHFMVNKQKTRNILSAENSGLIPSAIYFSEILTDDYQQRKHYFKKFLKKTETENSQLLFFDPDNGLEVKSKPKGRKHSSKYLYWDELCKFYSKSYSILIYQHFPRANRKNFSNSLAQQIIFTTNAAEVYTFQTSNVLFLLIPQKKHLNRLSLLSRRIAEQWEGQIMLEQYNCNPAK